MHVTEEQLQTLIASDPSNPALHAELKSLMRMRILRALPSPTGRCPHGKRIVWDQRGAYSSGYPIHTTEDGRTLPGYCDQFKGIVNDPDTPERARLLALLRELR